MQTLAKYIGLQIITNRFARYQFLIQFYFFYYYVMLPSHLAAAMKELRLVISQTYRTQDSFCFSQILIFGSLLTKCNLTGM